VLDKKHPDAIDGYLTMKKRIVMDNFHTMIQSLQRLCSLFANALSLLSLSLISLQLTLYENYTINQSTKQSLISSLPIEEPRGCEDIYGLDITLSTPSWQNTPNQGFAIQFNHHSNK
jgi:hypothetical protein